MRSHCARRVRWESIKIYCSGGRTTTALPRPGQTCNTCHLRASVWCGLTRRCPMDKHEGRAWACNQMLTGVGLNYSFWARVGLRYFAGQSQAWILTANWLKFEVRAGH